MNFTYRFPAVKGKQAGREYYISMVPLKLLARLFPAEEEIVPPEHRAQRRICETRIPEIKKYILDNRGSYVFSSGKNMGTFKAVGFPEDVGEFYRLEEYEGYSWTAHGRYPTNTPAISS